MEVHIEMFESKLLGEYLDLKLGQSQEATQN
jgi:hypothetical protein